MHSYMSTAMCTQGTLIWESMCICIQVTSTVSFATEVITSHRAPSGTSLISQTVSFWRFYCYGFLSTELVRQPTPLPNLYILAEKMARQHKTEKASLKTGTVMHAVMYSELQRHFELFSGDVWLLCQTNGGRYRVKKEDIGLFDFQIAHICSPENISQNRKETKGKESEIRL